MIVILCFHIFVVPMLLGIAYMEGSDRGYKQGHKNGFDYGYDVALDKVKKLMGD